MLNVFKFLRGLVVKPKTGTSEADSAGEIEVLSSDNKLRYHNGVSSSPVVTESHAATLTNKSIDLDNNTVTNIEVDNLKTGVLNISDTLVDATNDQIPAALAVKTFIEDSTSAVQSDVDALIALSGVSEGDSDLGTFTGTIITDNSTIKGALQELETFANTDADNLANHINDTVDAHDASAISVSPFGNLAATDAQSAFAEQQGTLDALVALSGVSEGQETLGSFTGTTIPNDSDNKEALQALETGLEDHITDTTGAHAASAISNVPSGNLSATNQQSVNNELQTDIDTRATQTALDAHINDTVDAHAGSAITNTPSGNLSATTMQGAVNELQTDIDTRLTGPASSTDNHLVRFDGTTGKVAQDGSTAVLSDAGALSGLTNLTVDNLNLDGNTITGGTSSIGIGTNIVETTATKILDGALVNIPFVDSTTTGANASISLGNYKNLILTDASLTSIDTLVPSVAISGRELAITNRTGNDITINNETGASTSSQISTGTGAAVTLKNKQTFAFQYDTTGNKWTVVGGTGSGTGSAGTTDVDILSVDSYDSATTGDYTQTGLTFNTTTPIHGAQSAQLIHQGAINQSYKKTISVDRKFRGQLVELSLSNRSTASEGNLTLLVTDETNAATIAASQSIQTDSVSISSLTITNGVAVIGGFSNADINYVQAGMAVSGTGIQTNTVISSVNTATNSVVISLTATSTTTTALRFSAVPTTRTFSFTVPTTCASMSYTITALPEAGSPRSTIDDAVLKLASVSLLETSVEVPVLTYWQAYTPTFTGFGTATSIEFEWRQNGQDVEVRGKFISGTSTAVEARISLPNGYTSGNTTLIPSIRVTGKGEISAVSTTNFGGLTVLIEPSVTYFTLGIETSTQHGLTKQNGNVLTVSGNTVSFFASTPINGLSATVVKDIPLTQSGLIQEADSMVRLDTSNGYGSTNNKILRFLNTTQNIGSDILYQDSATLGGSFTAMTSGVYDVTFSCNGTGAVHIGLSKNSTTLTTGIQSISVSERLAMATTSAASADSVASWSGYLVAGDIIRAHNDGTAPGTAALVNFTISYQGSLKQVNVNTDSKITIPTSELRFEGASARGAVATFIAKFDTQAKIRGDAFTVTNTSNDGTFVTMTKTGKLSVSATLSFAAANDIYITKNQAVLTTPPVLSEILTTMSTATANYRGTASWTGDVVVGDIIRVAAGANPNQTFNSLNLSFQEQQIAVSVTNTLPQFSESDSSVQLSGANGFGSTATTTRRFTTTIKNIGTDIQYTDSSTLGAQFVAMSDGVYHVSYSENSASNAAETSVFITVNGTNVAISRDSLNTASTANKIPSAAWSGYLVKGDIVTGTVNTAANNSGALAYFAISKVGKPNVTGVDVTPFVNVPQPDISEARYEGAAAKGATDTGVILFTSLVKSYGSGIAVTTTAANGTTIRVNKAGKISITGSVLTTASSTVQITKNQVGLTGTTATASEIINSFSSPTSPFQSIITADVYVSAGDIIRVVTGGTVASNLNNVLNVTHEALSDQILTAPETFSTDTAGLVYAGSASYTASTLTNALVGTFITYTLAASGNVRTQTTTAPTQTTSSMATDGIQVFGRAFNATSTAASPAVILIQIGKGQKGLGLESFSGAAKTLPTIFEYGQGSTNATEFGTKVMYDEKTGILTLDAGYVPSTAVSAKFSSVEPVANSGVSGSYFVINASKNPALTGMNLNKVAARVVQTSGQSIANSGEVTITWDAAKTYDTHGAFNAATGVFTAPETGYYEAAWGIVYTSAAYGAGNRAYTTLNKNSVNYALGQYATAEVATTSVLASVGSSGVYLIKGDTVNLITANNRTAAATALTTAASNNYFSITKVGP